MLKPIGDKALVRLDVKREEVRGGILVPDWVARKNASTATVIAVGNRVNPAELSVGNVILVPEEDRGTPIIQGGAMHYMIKVKNVPAVLE